MVTRMGMGFQNASEMGMKLEMHGSWNRNNLMGTGGNGSIYYISALL